jgi:hypothetical protein
VSPLLVRDSAMGKWFQTLPAQVAVSYICDCLRKSNSGGNVFWAIVTHYDLRAPTPMDLAQKVFDHLYDFDLSVMDDEDSDEVWDGD